MCAAEQHMDGRFTGQAVVRLTAATPSVCCEACATFYASQAGHFNPSFCLGMMLDLESLCAFKLDPSGTMYSFTAHALPHDMSPHSKPAAIVGYA